MSAPQYNRPIKVAALAGRRPDALDATTKRFPIANIPAVKQALTSLFLEQGFTTLVCSGACGADLLALEVAADLGLTMCIVLPFPPAAFRDSSVTDRPGEWGSLFDRIVEQVQSEGNLQVMCYEAEDEQAYYKTTVVIVATAQRLSQAQPAPAPVGIAVWDGQSRGGDDATQQFINVCEQFGLSKVEVSTLERPKN